MNATTKWTAPEHTVGVDLGDRKSVICRLDAEAHGVERRPMSTTRVNFEMYFSRLPKARVVLEVGTHSPWITRLLRELELRGRLRGPRTGAGRLG
jgi:transposase